MSISSSNRVDLQQLVVDHAGAPPSRLPRRRRLLARYVLPLAILLGFAGLVVWSARVSLWPAKAVTVTPVIVARAQARQAGATLFQAAGWVEPRPTAVTASALVEGVVEELLVVEGQAVERGQPLARLVDSDARLALANAVAQLDLREAELLQAKGALAAAKINLEQPIAMQAALAEAEAMQAKLQTEVTNLPFAIRTAKSRRQLAQFDLEGKQSVRDSIAGRSIQRAQSEFDSATAAVEELEQRLPSLNQEVQAWERRCAALRKQLELKTEETRRVSECAALVQAADAKLKQATLAVEAAQLQLDRMTVKSPLSGHVLTLYAQPGRRLMGMNAASERDASAVASLYNPRQLQIRADVRLEDLPQVQPGAPVQIASAALAAPLSGHVLGITSTADIQKNTLQVKVAIDDPPAVIKPEMLVQATFFAPQKTEDSSNEQTDPLRILVPRQLVESTDRGAFVWVADGSRGRARRQAVQLGSAGTDALVEVVEGLTALDKLIVGGREGLVEGQRIEVSGNDATLGVGGNGEATKPPTIPSNSGRQTAP